MCVKSGFRVYGTIMRCRYAEVLQILRLQIAEAPDASQA